MAGFSLKLPAGPQTVPAAYLIHGEELFLGRRFLRSLARFLAEPETGEAQVETFDLDAHRWPEIMDAAKSISFAFAPWRILAVEAKGAGAEDLSTGEAAAFRDYFASPSPRTVVAVLFQGKLRKTKPLAKAFAALPETIAATAEILPLKDRDLIPLIEKALEDLNKKATPKAVERILEITESDFARIASEVEKVSLFVGPKATIEADDVTALSSVKNFENYELTGALEDNNIDKALVILNSLFEEGTRPELIVGVLTGFFRDLLLAKTALREGRDPKDVFREVKPRITESYGGFYQRKLREFLAFLGRITAADAAGWLADLERIDRRIKKTEIDPETLIQVFLIRYGRAVSGRRVTSPGRR